jgi:hypothetical protein
MSEGKSAEFADLWQKVDTGADLTGKEKSLLLACLKIAWASMVETEELENGFKGSFTPEQADMIVQHASASGSIRSLTHLYGEQSIRSFVQGSISES